MKYMKNYLDLVKSINILLVVLGHILVLYNGRSFGLPENHFLLTINKGLYLFHMPLYIALSGAIFELCIERGKYSDFISFLKNKILRLLLPFLVVSIFFLAPTLYFLGLSHCNYIQTIMKSVCCIDAMDRHLWFLPALFWVFIVVWWLTHLKINIYVSYLLSILLSMAWFAILPGFDFFRLTHAVHYMPYFIFGMWIAKSDCLVGKKMVVYAAFALAISGGLMVINPIQVIDVGLLKLLSSAGIAFIIPIGKWAFSKLKKIYVLPYFLRNSYPIYLFHVMFIYTICSLLGDKLSYFLLIPLVFAISILASIFVAYCFRKIHLQFLVGEK